MQVDIPQLVGVLLDECLLVGNDAGVGDGGEDPDFIESILFFLLGEVVHFDFLHGVLLVVDEALDPVDRRVGPFAKLLDYLEIFQRHPETDEIRVFNYNNSIHLAGVA